MLQPSKVIYALSAQTSVPSPLEKNMSPDGSPITFSRDYFVLSKRQREALTTHARKWKDGGKPLLIAGFAQRGFPASYARSLSQRRAESVRQALIEEGIDAEKIHSAGYGHDQPSLSSGDEVLVYIIE